MKGTLALRPLSLRAHFAERALALIPSVAETLLALDDAYAPDSDRSSVYQISGGIVTIPVRGALSNRRSDAWWGEGSYDDLRALVDKAASDPACRAILLDVDSPGGEAAGAMELGAHIRAVSGRKPVVAFVDGMAASAAYAIASGAGEVITTPSATLGSIGVMMLHVDVSKRLSGAGIKPTLLHAGAFKVDGSSLVPLQAAAAGRLQAVLDDLYSHFVETVGTHRAALGAAGARKTEAGVFIGQRAVDAKLADRLGTLTDARAAALARINSPAIPRPQQTLGKTAMTAQLKQDDVHTEAEAPVVDPRKEAQNRGAAEFAKALGKPAPIVTAPAPAPAADSPDLSHIGFGRSTPYVGAELERIAQGRRDFAAAFGKSV